MIMRTTLILKTLTLGLAASLVASACGGGGDEGGSIEVVATTSILGDITANLINGTVTLTTIMPPGADPHEFEPSARQVATLRSADLIIANGLGLEESLEDVLQAAVEDGVQVVTVRVQGGYSPDHIQVLRPGALDGFDGGTAGGGDIVDDDHGVAAIDQTLEGRDELRHVGHVQPGRRLVEQVNIGRLGQDLRDCQALPLPAGQGLGQACRGHCGHEGAEVLVAGGDVDDEHRGCNTRVAERVERKPRCVTDNC